MTVWLRLVAGGVAAALAWSGAGAQDEPVAAAMEPGRVFVFSDGRVERVVEVRDDRTVWETGGGVRYTRAHNVALPILEWRLGDRTGERHVFGGHERMWPPRTGASARFRVVTDVSRTQGGQARSIQPWTCKIGRPTTVELPNGPFEAAPITCDRYSITTMRVLERRRWWWSPDIGHYVKRTFQDMRTGRRRSIVLCASLAPRWATAERIEALARDGC